MSNTNKVLDMIANEALSIAHEKATFIGSTSLQYDEDFKYEGPHKGGATLRVRDPNQYSRRQGSRVMDVQDQNESTQTITVATQDGVDMRFNSAELTLEVNDPKQVERFSKRYIEPAMSVLVSGIDGDYLSAMTKKVYNMVGTAGTVLGASGDISAIFNARAKLNQMLAPKDNDRALQLDSVTMASVVNGKTGLFHPEPQVKKAFTEGYYGRAGGADWYENERTYTHTTGSDLTATTAASAALSGNGATSLGCITATVVAGDVFTIAGVYACHPETKANLGYLQQFVATAVATQAAISISPTVYISGAKQNVCSSSGAALAATDFNSQSMVFVGSASTSYRNSLMYHKDAFAFVTADLPLMDGQREVRAQAAGQPVDSRVDGLPTSATTNCWCVWTSCTAGPPCVRPGPAGSPTKPRKENYIMAFSSTTAQNYEQVSYHGPNLSQQRAATRARSSRALRQRC
jgi:hypothetical protein